MDDGLDLPGERVGEMVNSNMPLPPVAEVTTEPAVAALSRDAIARLIDKWEQVSRSGASYSEYCSQFVADLRELI